MSEYIRPILDEAKDQMQKALDHLDQALLRIRTGKANPVMLDSVRVSYYGASTPLNQLASVSVADARTLTVQPFDKSILHDVEKGIVEANLGFNPQNDGNIIRIPIPQLTEDRRKQLAKQAKEEGEQAKISIRHTRRDQNEKIKKLKDDGVSEDAIKRGEDEIQKITDNYTQKVDDILKAKEAEIMTI